MDYCKTTREKLLARSEMPIINTLEDFANKLLVSETILRKISLHSYTYYKEFYIPKKSSNNMRKIIAPKYTLKVIQAWILRNILEKVKLHESAMAYRKGTEFGIKRNASIHKEKQYIMKADFKDFFSSIPRAKIFLCLMNLDIL
ncbi:MAG: hypothetical protein KZY61_12220 [Clostridiaceae bacterium]|nr:hypothetical protein [Clostridiaceae bacterium]MBW4859385.1 hypothetical protein [Clostridiaceae bacterium]MBW4869393.1 hypothetical protein [Clostridiaceae bacterium]